MLEEGTLVRLTRTNTLFFLRAVTGLAVQALEHSADIEELTFDDPKKLLTFYRTVSKLVKESSEAAKIALELEKPTDTSLGAFDADGDAEGIARVLVQRERALARLKDAGGLPEDITQAIGELRKRSRGGLN